MIISKIIRFLNGYKISRANGISKVKIRDSQLHISGFVKIPFKVRGVCC